MPYLNTAAITARDNRRDFKNGRVLVLVKKRGKQKKKRKKRMDKFIYTKRNTLVTWAQ